jgi:hypothetical protein
MCPSFGKLNMCGKFDVAGSISFFFFPAYKVYLQSDAASLTFDLEKQ